MTGWYPHVRGYRTLWHLLRPEEPNLLAYLKDAGYDVRMWGKNDLLAPGSWEKSVTVSAEPRGQAKPEPAFRPDEPGYYSFLGRPRDEAEGPTHDQLCVERAIDYLRSKPTQPFCLYLPLQFPHPTYGALRKWQEMFDESSVPDLRPTELPGKPDFHALIRQYRHLDQIDPAILRRCNAAYLAQIAEIDELFGQLMTAMDEAGHADDTTVLFFSDHGDWAGDYGLVEKWPSGLDDCLTRIPFVMRTPGGTGGHVVRECVEAFDLTATVLDLAGIEATHTHFARSLVPQLRGAPGEAGRAAFAEGGYATHEPHCFEGDPVRDATISQPENLYYPKCLQQQEHPNSVCRATMIRTQTHKLIHRVHGMCELYDLDSDPRELNNVYDAPAYATTRDRLQHRLLNWYVETSDVTPFDDDPRGRSDPR